jgi:hypothetical protein
MPTAIIRFFTSQGFVIAADGYSTDVDKRVTEKNVQKIFPIPNSFLVYTLQGTVCLGDEPNRLDLAREIRNIVDSISISKMADLSQYAESLERPIYKLLVRWHSKNPKFPEQLIDEADQPGRTILRVMLLGYFNGRPSEVGIRFFHRDHTLVKVQVISYPLQVGFYPGVFGSAKIAELLFDSQDARFAAYRIHRPETPEALTITDAAEAAQRYIMACDSDLGRDVDPDIAPTIGGHIHIASITPSGFGWVPGFEPCGSLGSY